MNIQDTAPQLIILSFLYFISACGLTTEAPAPAPVDRMDTTIGSYGKGREDNLLLVTMEADAHRSLTQRLSIRSPTNTPSDLPLKYANFLADMSEQYGITRVADWPLNSIGIYCLVFEMDGQQETASIIAQLNSDNRIETAQAMQIFDVQSQPNYNDPYLPLQHGFQTMQADYSHQWASGSGVKVAVIDTGMDVTHPDLSDRVFQSRNFVDKNTQQFNRDIHGTAVAGIIAAAANNDTGMVGIAPSAQLMALKACWQSSGADGSAKCNSFTLAKALNFAIGNKVDVINLSLTGPRDPLLERLASTAVDNNIIVIGALPENTNDAFPVAVKGTIAVTTSGKTESGALRAPGRKVLSTRPDDDYEFYTGSSFSAAHIAGLAALVRDLRSESTPLDVLELLESTADTKTGDVNACEALATLAAKFNKPVAECPPPFL